MGVAHSFCYVLLMKPLLTIGALDHISSQERANLGLPFSVQLTTREQQALRTRSKYFRGIPKYLDRGVRTFRGSKYFMRSALVSSSSF